MLSTLLKVVDIAAYNTYMHEKRFPPSSLSDLLRASRKSQSIVLLQIKNESEQDLHPKGWTFHTTYELTRV